MVNPIKRALGQLLYEVRVLPDRRFTLGAFSDKSDPALPRLMINSVPKSGTYLVGRLATLLGFHDLRIHLLETAYWDYNLRGNLHKWKALNGYEQFENPRLLPQYPAAALKRVRPGQYVVAHINPTPALVRAIERLGVKHLFVYRDPRDVAVSYVQFTTNRPDRNPPHRAHEYFTQVLTSDDERLMATIRGVEGVQGNLYDWFYAGKIDWLEDPAACCVRFEDLIGEQGGGSRQTQERTIGRILEFLEIPSGPQEIERVAGQLFGGQTHTFNRGQIGAWREVFTLQHAEALKAVCGDLLQRLGYEQDDEWGAL